MKLKGLKINYNDMATPETVGGRNEVKLAVMSEKVTNIEGSLVEIKKSIDELVRKIDDTYVTKNEFGPVKSVVYGLVTLILTSVVGAVIYLVIK